MWAADYPSPEKQEFRVFLRSDNYIGWVFQEATVLRIRQMCVCVCRDGKWLGLEDWCGSSLVIFGVYNFSFADKNTLRTNYDHNHISELCLFAPSRWCPKRKEEPK